MVKYSVDVTGCQSVISTCRATMDGKDDHFASMQEALHNALQACVGSITADGGAAKSEVGFLGLRGDFLWDDDLEAAHSEITSAITENIDRFEEAVNYYLEGDHIMEMVQQTRGRDNGTLLFAPEVTQNDEVVHEAGYIYGGIEEVQEFSPIGETVEQDVDTDDAGNVGSTKPFANSPKD